MHARFLEAGWTTPLKLEVLRGLSKRRAPSKAGTASPGTSKTCRATSLPASTTRSGGSCWPRASSGPPRRSRCWPSCPEHPSHETLAQISKLDRQVKRLDTEAAKKLRIGICAVLGISGDPEAMTYLRGLYEVEPDRRVPIAMALAQQPGRRKLALSGAFVADRRRRGRAGSADPPGTGRPGPGRCRGHSPGDPARSDAARHRQPQSDRAVGKMDRAKTGRTRRAVGQGPGPLAGMVR